MHLTANNSDINLESLQGRQVTVKRFFSNASAFSNVRFNNYNYAEVDSVESAVCSIEFFLKLAQLLCCVISAGLYSKGMFIMFTQITSSLMFPNVVHSAYLIITSVIAISYALRHAMAPVLVRIFNFIALVLYSISAAIILHGWINREPTIDELKNAQDFEFAANMLLAHFFVNLLAVVFYTVDLWLSIKKALIVKTEEYD